MTTDSEQTICSMCGIALDEENRARKKKDGAFRNDAFGRGWCVKCAEVHDRIVWSMVRDR